MTTFSTKMLALTAVLAVGTLMSSSAHAALLRSTDGAPVLTKDGSCVITNWEGSEGCEAAKAAAGMTGTAVADTVEHGKAVYFDFNSSKLTTDAKNQLDHLAKMLTGEGKHHHHHHHLQSGDKAITIVGYADRMGNAAYNEKLAEKRAEAVRSYLSSKGVKADLEIRSMGKTAPKAECSADLPRAKLIQCLREDRRVEIEFGCAK